MGNARDKGVREGGEPREISQLEHPTTAFSSLAPRVLYALRKLAVAAAAAFVYKSARAGETDISRIERYPQGRRSCRVGDGAASRILLCGRYIAMRAFYIPLRERCDLRART